MSLFVEHQSIKRALAMADLSQVLREPELSSHDATFPVFVGWSSRETLVLKPEYALLSSDEIRYLRLPQQLETLIESIGKATMPYEASAMLKGLHTPLGQWRWALKELRNSILTDDYHLASLRLIELQRFASKHWPGYYDMLLTSLSMAMTLEDDAVRRIMLVESNAVSVAVLVACAPLTEWIEDRAKANHVAMTSEIVAYLDQDALEIQDIKGGVTNFAWIKDLKNDLATTEETLNAMSKAGFDPDSLLGNRMKHMRDAVLQAEVLGEGLFCSKQVELAPLKAAVGTISRVTADLVEMRSRVKAALAN